MHRQDFTLEATGTKWSISWWTQTLSDQDSQNLWESCVFIVEDFEQKYSRFNEDSFLSSLKDRKGILSVPDEFVEMLKIYRDLYELSDGRITPLGGEMISALGYNRDYTFIPTQQNTTVPGFTESVRIISDEQIDINKGLNFDLGALGKGFLIDLLMDQILENKGIRRVLINAGGDIAHYARDGEKARIALEHPEDPSQALGVIEIGNEALASSGTSKRMWGKDKQLHHIYDPHLGVSSTDVQSSWIIAPSAVLADALATSLFLVDVNSLLELYEFDHAFIAVNGDLAAGKRFTSSFFTQD